MGSRTDDRAAEFAGMTVAEVLVQVDESRWCGRPSRITLMSQAKQALAVLTLIARPDLQALSPAERNETIRHNEISHDSLRVAVRLWRNNGLAAYTIRKRLVCMNLLGYPSKGLYPPLPRNLKWWLKPEAETALVAHLRETGDTLMADYVVWTTATGLRVEESLRLTHADFSEADDGRVFVTVPGLKTSDAQATLPLTALATEIFRSRHGEQTVSQTPLFAISYKQLLCRWTKCRAFLGVTGAHGATLKALRRSAARNLHAAKGMPLDMVRHYLRHENVQTTMGYLRLTGGYGAEEFSRWL